MASSISSCESKELGSSKSGFLGQFFFQPLPCILTLLKRLAVFLEEAWLCQFWVILPLSLTLVIELTSLKVELGLVFLEQG